MSGLAKRMTVTIIGIASASILVSAIYYRSMAFLPFLLGILLGSAVSIAKVFLLERAVDKVLKMEQKHAANYIGVQHIMRLLLSGVVLFLGAAIPQISLWGVAVGILAFPLATYGIKFTSKS